MKLQWVGGEHEFALNIGQLRALQKACDAGPEQILTRIWSGEWRVDDLIEVLRLGLIGGGDVDRKDAGQLVSGLFDKHAILQFKPVAQAVLMDALTGDDGDPVGEPAGATTPPANGSSVKSTEVEP